MISLGIESTAHTFGIGVVSDEGEIILERRDMFVPENGEGFIPSDLANHHYSVAPRLLKGVDMKKVDLISFSRGPGIPNALAVGSAVARYIAGKYRKPIVGVNHAVAHIEIGRLMAGCKDPVVVYLSGGNTQIITHYNGRYRVLGESEDIPVGNLFDVFARYAGLGMPGGPAVERAAKKGKYVEIPYVVKGMDLSFTGMLTAAKRRLKAGERKENLCFSLQETAFSMLTEVAERALAHTEKGSLLVVGGVASNERLKEMMGIMCEERGADMYVVPKRYATDNGAMIAWTGLLSFRPKAAGITKNCIYPKWRVHDVEAPWYYEVPPGIPQAIKTVVC